MKREMDSRIRGNAPPSHASTKHEISAGGVVFRITSETKPERFKILLIKDSYGRWALPKGHIGDKIKGETSEHAALRECSEETGIPLKDLKIIDKLGDIQYFYQLKGERIFKIVRFFLIKSTSEELKKCWEIQDVRWFEPEIAVSKNEYANSRAIIEKAVEKIKVL